MSNEKINKRKEQAAGTRKKLFDSADKLFREHDFATVSVDSIVEEAGVSKGTFYVHFESKDALIAALIAEYATRLDLDYQGYLDTLSPGMHALDLLLALVGRISDVLVYTVGYDMMRTVYQLQLTRDIDMDAVKGYNRELYKIVSLILEQGLQRKEFTSDLPLSTLARHFVMAIRGICYEWCIRYPDFDLKAEATTHFRLLFEGIRGERSS